MFGWLEGTNNNIAKVNVDFTLLSATVENAGGLIGYAINTNIDTCSTTGSYKYNNLVECYAGGIVGDVRDSTINNSTVEIEFDLTGAKNGYFGTIAGYMVNTTYNNTTTDAIVEETILDDESFTLGAYGTKITN